MIWKVAYFSTSDTFKVQYQGTNPGKLNDMQVFVGEKPKGPKIDI
jgi:hypothetical protein